MTEDKLEMGSGARMRGAKNVRSRSVAFPYFLSSYCVSGTVLGGKGLKVRVVHSLFLLCAFHLLERILRRQMTWIVVVGMERPEETGEGSQGLVNDKACAGGNEGCKCGELSS